MAYTPFTWHDGPGGGTPIIATRLNAIEQGVSDAHDVTDLVAPLGPHVQALLDGRIVEHNLDVPQNDWDIQRYIRYDTGIQVLLSFRDIIYPFDWLEEDQYTRFIYYTGNIADFIGAPTFASLQAARLDEIGVLHRVPLITNYDREGSSPTSTGFIVDALGLEASYLGDVALENASLLIVGRWK